MLSPRRCPLPTLPRCLLCRDAAGPFTVAAYEPGPSPEQPRYVAWLCARCATLDGATHFAAAVVQAHGPVRFIVAPDGLWAAPAGPGAAPGETGATEGGREA